MTFFLLNRTYLLLALAFLFLLLFLVRHRKQVVTVIRENRRLSIFATILVFGLASILLFFVNAPGISLATKAQETPSSSFIFFEIGENTLLTKTKIKDLDKILGQSRLENLTPVSLDFIGEAWMPANFPELKESDAFFKTERLVKPVASKTLKLDFRYAAQHAPPFTHVHFVFSDYSKHPLLGRMRLDGDGRKTLDSITERYGPPQKIEEKKALLPVLFWKNKNDLLIFAVLPDRYGKAETQLFIVYGKNLEAFREDILKNYPEPTVRTGF